METSIIKKLFFSTVLYEQGGVYHGRILVPADYPMKPPDIIVLTPNGRFSEIFCRSFLKPHLIDL